MDKILASRQQPSRVVTTGITPIPNIQPSAGRRAVWEHVSGRHAQTILVLL